MVGKHSPTELHPQLLKKILFLISGTSGKIKRDRGVPSIPGKVRRKRRVANLGFFLQNVTHRTLITGDDSWKIALCLD